MGPIGGDLEPAFSVIIPLGFDRGLAGECVLAWSRQQDFPRERFEILVAAPTGRPTAERDVVRTILGTADRLLELPVDHDMDLVAAAAPEARGDVLLFTEAHCLPNPDVLSRAAAVLHEHPRWAGFSGGSIPATHNLLSEIEADMYAADIRRNLEDHPWLKVLDQILVLRRTAYLECGGIEPEYGHFAEWVLAARLHARGLEIGYEPSVAVHHYYVGHLAELEEFTEDFGRGQMLFMIRRATTATQCFEAPLCWDDRLRFHPKVARSMLRLLWRDRAALTDADDRKAQRLRRRSWLLRALGGTFFEWRAACNTARVLRRKTERCLEAGDRAAARDSFHLMVQACAAKGHVSALREAWNMHDDAAFTHFSPVNLHGSWFAGDPAPMIKTGFFPCEHVSGQTFRWTWPEAMVWLPLVPGKYELRVRWVWFPQLGGGRYRFFIDEHPVPPGRMLELPDGMEIHLHVTSPTVCGLPGRAIHSTAPAMRARSECPSSVSRGCAGTDGEGSQSRQRERPEGRAALGAERFWYKYAPVFSPRRKMHGNIGPPVS